MKINDYVTKLPVIERLGDVNPEIKAITFNSREAGKDVMFVAIKGTKSDGHDFILSAIEAGSPAVVCESVPNGVFPGVVFIKVADTAETLGIIASLYYGNPSEQLNLIGVTGTNGKTTTATLLYRLCKEMGYKAGLCSTIANYIDDDKEETTHTTPDVLTLNSLMRKMVDRGCQFCFMEVSSHSVVQKRIAGVKFKGGIFTNLTHDHLDYHGTFDAYLKAKKEFFDKLGKDAFALVNLDDRNGEVMVQNTKAKKYTYSLREMADFRTKVVECSATGMHLEISRKEVWTPFTGKFNASNLTAVYGAATLLGFEQEHILQILSKLTPVDGRFETIRSKNGVVAIVDYAHTPDALKNVIETINNIRDAGKFIVVVGAGGDRDPLKRPIMAKEAVKGADLVILTSDNPRTENPEDIINQMREGVNKSETNKVISITNRKEAIRTACLMASSGDIILIAGKGHETYQEINGIKYHFDDREVVGEFLQ